MPEIPHMRRAVLGLGSNLSSSVGSSRDLIMEAVRGISSIDSISMLEGSRIYSAKAWPLGTDQPDFVNLALLIETNMPADKLLESMQNIEEMMGRESNERWGPRVIDIDILAYEDSILPSQALWHSVVNHDNPAYFLKDVTVPHPRLHERGFALIPFAEVYPHWLHPVFGKTAKEMASSLSNDEKNSLELFE